MPITPYHIGPGILVKALVPARFSFSAFAATEIVVDLEPAYHALQGHWPAHRMLHTVVGSLTAGAAVALCLYVARRPVGQALAALPKIGAVGDGQGIRKTPTRRPREPQTPALVERQRTK